MIIPITPEDAPPPFGAYSVAAQVGNLVQVSGQIGMNPATSSLAGETAYDQARQALNNVAAILAECDLDFADVLMLRVYVAAPEQFPDINRAFREKLTAPYPARTTLFGGLPPGIFVEIDALAVLR